MLDGFFSGGWKRTGARAADGAIGESRLPSFPVLDFETRNA
jgi:hypothetical protein